MRDQSDPEAAAPNWCRALIGSDGFLRIDVRLQIATHDGANLCAQNCGLLEMNDAAQAAIARGAGTDYRDQYFSSGSVLIPMAMHALANIWVGLACVAYDR